jgi:glutamate synthase (NADPH/NADH) large chain
MTGGRVVVLGDTGRNFAAGMSGGIAYVWDSQMSFVRNCNMEMVGLEPLDADDERWLKEMIGRHVQLTRSQRADALLKEWSAQAGRFIKVMPTDYKAVLDRKKQEAIAITQS